METKNPDTMKVSTGMNFIWAATLEIKLSSGFLDRSSQNRPAQLQRLARIVKFRFEQVLIKNYATCNYKQIAKALIRLYRLVCTFVVSKPQKTGFLS